MVCKPATRRNVVSNKTLNTNKKGPKPFQRYKNKKEIEAANGDLSDLKSQPGSEIVCWRARLITVYAGVYILRRPKGYLAILFLRAPRLCRV